VLVAPNNPTGQTFSNSDLVRIVDYCIRAKAILVLDFAFRFFDPSMVWDQYELLDGSGVSYLAIEDLGKIWPTRDLKVGILTSSADLYAETDRVHDDFLLNVSPFTLELLSRFCTAREPALVLADIQALPLHNRRTLVASLAPFGLVDRTSMATLSVAWLQLPANYPDSFEFCALAERHGVHVLPGPLFYFERRALGTHLVRLALMRDPPIVDEGCRRLQSLCRQLMTC
jgi:aspartate/methionine/tyrosine aminotransferase